MTLTIKLHRNWSSFQLANRAPPLSVTDSSIAPSARMHTSLFTSINNFTSAESMLLTGCVNDVWLPRRFVLWITCQFHWIPSVSLGHPHPLAENFRSGLLVCLVGCSAWVANLRPSKHTEACTLKKRQPESWSSQPLRGSKMSILGLKDHFSRDPVQVQSLDVDDRRGTLINGKRHWPTRLQESSSEAHHEHLLSMLYVGDFRITATQHKLVLVVALKQTTSWEILLWMTPSEAPEELLDPTRANCWISAQHQPGKITSDGWAIWFKAKHKNASGNPCYGCDFFVAASASESARPPGPPLLLPLRVST